VAACKLSIVGKPLKRVAPFQYASGRFVLLYHYFEPGSGESDAAVSGKPQFPPLFSRGQNHWDLMFEMGDVLLTYRLLALPQASHSIDLAVQRLPDHRRHYLEYEGPVSGQRGAVSRWAAGQFSLCDDRFRIMDIPHTVAQGEPQVAWVKLSGAELHARMLLAESQVGDWLTMRVAGWELATRTPDSARTLD
jgi:hypothetical protein